mmetsp:Transcript_17441/g.34974  ORF Transcript_17441/g.34974 Transcript_17441/m.34974 type:complete len:558 (+) Transcript_17441:167-1840(+)
MALNVMVAYSFLVLALLTGISLTSSFRIAPTSTCTSNARSRGAYLHLHAHASSSSSSSPPTTTAPILEDGRRAYPQQTPHSGRHFLPSHPSYHTRSSRTFRSLLSSPGGLLRRLNPLKRNAFKTKRKRFMEGWYYRLTLPESNASFAFIFSIDDPISRGGTRNGTDLSLAAMQIMGPDDGYMTQCDRDDSKFWAWEASQGLGCTFEWNDDATDDDDDDDDEKEDRRMITAMDPTDWREKVKTGFQVLPNRLQGKLNGRNGAERDALLGKGAPSICDFDMSITPLSGWGDDVRDDVDRTSSKQRSTAGWLASFAVFEPHWQVTLADARATGTVNWNGTIYEFDDAPFYAEKNWGGSFPSHWYWVQCNAFDGYDRLSVTAGGGTRKIPLGKTESLGMVSVHYDGVFYEAVPWTGDMEWDVDPWGRWILTGRCTSGTRLFEAQVKATCNPEITPGVTLRAPTKDNGLAYFCRDSFLADTSLSLWQLRWDEEIGDHVRVDGPPIIDCATSKQGGIEIGGGPWWDTWKSKSNMKEPMKTLVAFPYLKRGILKRGRKKRNTYN